MIRRLKKWAKTMRQNIYALYLASRDPEVPLIAKIIVIIVTAYAFSPIDLIPDFIPVVGYLDDLVLLPLGIAIAVKMIPADVWEDCKKRASSGVKVEINRRLVAVFIVFLWILIVFS